MSIEPMVFRYIVCFPALLALPIALRELHSIGNIKAPQPKPGAMTVNVLAKA